MVVCVPLTAAPRRPSFRYIATTHSCRRPRREVPARQGMVVAMPVELVAVVLEMCVRQHGGASSSLFVTKRPGRVKMMRQKKKKQRRGHASLTHNVVTTMSTTATTTTTTTMTATMTGTTCIPLTRPSPAQ
jgi:hypothetical protein